MSNIREQLAAILASLEGNAQPAQPQPAQQPAQQPAPAAAPADDKLEHIMKTVAGLAESVAKLSQPKPSTGQPISDKGSPLGGVVPDWRRELVANPIRLSPAARQQMEAELGVEGARRKRVEYANSIADKIRIGPPPIEEPNNGVTWDVPSVVPPKVKP